NQDVVSISATSSDKILTFWMLLLFHPQGIQVIVTPLNILKYSGVWYGNTGPYSSGTVCIA
ncbi:hypothetical protein BDR05DRAFT_888309, partial [Suillus weaverae]